VVVDHGITMPPELESNDSEGSEDEALLARRGALRTIGVGVAALGIGLPTLAQPVAADDDDDDDDDDDRKRRRRRKNRRKRKNKNKRRRRRRRRRRRDDDDDDD